MDKVLTKTRATVRLQSMARGVVESIRPEGLVLVSVRGLGPVECEVLLGTGLELGVGDKVLLAPGYGEDPAVVVGTVGCYAPPAPSAHVKLEATESLTLRCGSASVELRADGRALLKGDDVVVRAKGTKRIRAGHVAIN